MASQSNLALPKNFVCMKFNIRCTHGTCMMQTPLFEEFGEREG